MSANTITIIKPDDFHLHVRDDEILKASLPYSNKWAARAIIMPNINPAVNSIAAAESYRQRILSLSNNFTPLMTWYLGKDDSLQEILFAWQSGLITALKWYPKGATTNSAEGLVSWQDGLEIFKLCEEYSIPVLFHGESVASDVDFMDREVEFINRELIPLLEKLPNLRCVFEHVSTKEAVEFVLNSNDNIAATVTPQHLTLNQNDLFAKGFNPHLYCFPIVKKRKDMYAIQEAVLSGNKKFFLGTDSAPHILSKKQNFPIAGGVFSSPVALQIYAQFFDNHSKLNMLEDFTSKNGANWYGLNYNQEQLTLIKQDDKIEPIDAIALSSGEQIKPMPLPFDVFWNLL